MQLISVCLFLFFVLALALNIFVFLFYFLHFICFYALSFDSKFLSLLSLPFYNVCGPTFMLCFCLYSHSFFFLLSYSFFYLADAFIRVVLYIGTSVRIKKKNQLAIGWEWEVEGEVTVKLRAKMTMMVRCNTDTVDEFSMNKWFLKDFLKRIPIK
jgi:hypothetical protein